MLLGHRYYDANIGRFLSSDPAQAGTNWYAYCGNNPLTRVDPTGNSWLAVVLCVAADAAIAVIGGGPEDPIVDVGAAEADTAIEAAVDGGGGGDTNPGDDGGDDSSNCFAAGTLVWLSGGKRVPIQDVKLGEQVLTRSPEAKTAAPICTAVAMPRNHI